MNSKKLLAILGAAGVAANVAGHLVPTAHASASPAALEQSLQDTPTGADASVAFDLLAARFKSRDDKGRPDKFGPPGKPDIGPPGHYDG